MTEQEFTPTPKSLEALAAEIEQKSKQADEHVLEAAKLIAEARRRVEAGEAGDATWYGWARENIGLSPSRLYELQSIAEAPDPATELERQRQANRERVKEHREKQKARERLAREPERKQLIDWAKEAPIEDVRWLLQKAQGRINPAANANEPPGRETLAAA